jgi:hypothetical protein
MPTTTEKLFDEVVTIIQSRGTVYGHPAINHKRIADLWSAYLDYPIQPHQAALCMALVKVARLSESPSHDDSLIDCLAYIAISKTVYDAQTDAEFGWEIDSGI